MQFFNIGNFFGIITIFIILLFSGFSFYFPLFKIYKSPEIALKFSIPLSISLEIIFGYFFYSFGIVHLFPIAFLIFILSLNIYSFRALNFELAIIFKNSFKKIRGSYLYLLLIVPLLYSRFFDSVTNVAPGNNDTFNHLNFIKDLVNHGFLNNPYYAPGYHLLLYPLTFFVSYENIYRFAGPVVGCIVILSIFLLFKNSFKHSLSKIIFIALSCLFVFNQFSLQTISLFSSALSFIFVACFIYLISKPKELSEKSLIIFYFILTTSLALTVPYLFVQLIPVALIIYLFSHFSKKDMLKISQHFFFKILIISIVGFFISFGHVYLQTNIIRKNIGFPKINTVNSDGSLGSNYQSEFTNISPKLTQNILISKYALPMIEIGLDIVKVKNIRPANTILGAGAYVWLAISIFLLIYSIRKNDTLLFGLASFSIIFGISTQTGILEMSFYRGRAGWYLLMFALLGSTFIFDIFYKTKYQIPSMIFILISSFSAILFPPHFYRPYFNDSFAFAYQIKNKFPNQKINFVTNHRELSLLSENFSTNPLKIDYLQKDKNFDQQFIILDNKFFFADPVLSQSASSADKNFALFKEEQLEDRSLLENDINDVKNSPLFENYFSYFKNNNVSVFILK